MSGDVVRLMILTDKQCQYLGHRAGWRLDCRVVTEE